MQLTACSRLIDEPGVAMMKALLTAVSVGALLMTAPAWAQNTPAQNPPAQNMPAQNPPAQNMPAQNMPAQNMPAQNGAQQQSQNTAQPQSWNNQDKTFVNEASSANLAEAELGRLAWQKSQQPAIKLFGRWMDADHTLANTRLKAIVQQDHATFQPQLTTQQQQMKQRLQALSGNQFDQQYLQAMSKSHQMVINEFQQEAQQGQDQEIKTYAQNMTPVLQQHLDAVKELTASMSNMASTASNPTQPSSRR